ncbi:MAG: hypothetical protein QM734_16650 [Cyclobacteriaceae bacterium]
MACLSIVEQSKTKDRTSVAEIALDKGRKRMLYDSRPFDNVWHFLLKYKNLSATKVNGQTIFSGTINLFDIKTNQLVLEKDFTGESSDNSDSPKCNGSAECAMTGFIDISSKAVIDFIENHQKK